MENLILELLYEGEGKFRTARPFDYRLASKALGEGELIMRVAKPWRFSKTDHETANAVMQRVVDEICTNIVPGVTPEQLLDMAKQEAA